MNVWCQDRDVLLPFHILDPLLTLPKLNKKALNFCYFSSFFFIFIFFYRGAHSHTPNMKIESCEKFLRLNSVFDFVLLILDNSSGTPTGKTKIIEKENESKLRKKMRENGGWVKKKKKKKEETFLSFPLAQVESLAKRGQYSTCL